MSMSDWAKREVEIACKRENPDRKEWEFDYGCGCYESALKAYLSLMEDGYSGMSFGFTRNILIRLMDGLPLTPIEDNPEEWNLVYEEEDGTKVYQCRRMSSLFKNIRPDGTVTYDRTDDYYCKDVETGVTYSGGGAREIIDRYAKPITLPYFPTSGKYVLTTAEYLTDRANGDFDTKAYFTLKMPDGECVPINEYYGEIDGEWKQITRSEYDERIRKHFERERTETERMRCDKCKKVCDDNWTPGFGYPKFDIKERESLMSSIPINLCLKCSQDFKKWLHGNDKPEDN